MPLYVHLGERDYRDGVDIQPDDIYAHVAAGGALATTAALNMADYVQVFSEYSRRVDFVIHVCISSEFSSCYQNARLAAAEYPNVYVVDSRNLSTGHGLVVLEAVRLAESGMQPQQIVAELNALTARVRASFILDQLKYMEKGGRCSSVAVLGANLLRLRPCITVKDGKMGVEKKYRGSFESCLRAYITEQLKDNDRVDLRRVFITHSGIDDAALALARETVESLQQFEEVCITRAGCTISSHCGPRTIGVLFIEK